MVQVFTDSIDEIAAIKYANMAVSTYATSPANNNTNLEAGAQLPPPRKRSATHAIQHDNVKIMRDDDKANNNNVVDAVVPLSADAEVTRKLSKLSMVLSFLQFAYIYTLTHTHIYTRTPYYLS